MKSSQGMEWRESAEKRIGRVGLSLRVGRGWAPAYFFFFFFVKSDPIVLLWAGFSSLRGSPGLMLNQVQNPSVGGQHLLPSVRQSTACGVLQTEDMQIPGPDPGWEMGMTWKR